MVAKLVLQKLNIRTSSLNTGIDCTGFHVQRSLKTECIYRQKIATFQQAKELIDEFIHFYNHERIQLKTGVAPLTQRHSA